MAWSPKQRRHATVLALIVGLYLAHYAVWCLGQPFFIEDSGISFAFARNIATGLGAVPFAGGERVEAYSNASWTFLLAALYVFHFDPFFAAKALGAIFGAITVVVVWAIGHEARGGPLESADAEGEGAQSAIPEWAPLLGPALLAASTQFTLWNASGLENSLFNLLLSTGIWRLCVEIRTGSRPGSRMPWSALAFFLLTMTRPDGLGYAAVGLFARVLGTLRNRQWAALPIWLAVFAAPYAAYNAVRYEYFAWWFPNTYYAKEKTETVKLLGWVTGGWKQFKDWAFFYGVVFAAPAVVVALLPSAPALLGRRGPAIRKAVLAFVLVGFALGCLWDGRLPASIPFPGLNGDHPGIHLPTAFVSWWSSHVGREWNAGVVWFLLGSAVLLGLLTLPERGWAARGLLWGSFSVGVFFWVWSSGDWMKGFRWGSLVAVPVFTLIGLGIGVLAESLPGASRPAIQWILARTPRTRWGWVLLGFGGATAFALFHLGPSTIWSQLPSNPKSTLFERRSLAPLLPAAWFPLPKGNAVAPFTAIPIATILAFTLGTLRKHLPPSAAEWRGPRAASAFAALAGFALALPNTWKSYEFANAPETSVNDVHRRANYMGGVAEKLDLDDITLLDVDMGAHLYFTRWHVGDLAGLIDVAMSRHKAQKSFIDDYIFNELKPTFAHVHGSWANQSKIPRNPKWKEQYLEITGYPSGKRGYHVGNHIRKELVARTDYRGPEGKQVDFAGGVTMAGWELPSPEIAPGGKLYLHTWWIATPRKVGFRVLAFLKDAAGHLHGAEVAPANDWYKPEKWTADEYVEGSWYIPIPESLPKGDYDLGIVVLDPTDNHVLARLGAAADPAASVDPAAPGDPAAPSPAAAPAAPAEPVRYLAGEWVAPAAVHLVSAEEAMAKANEVLAESLKLAAGGQCEQARARFKDARRHIVRNVGWRDNHEPQLNHAVVGCYVDRANGLQNLFGQSEAIAHALRIDPTDPEALAAGKRTGAALYAEGMAAREASKPQEAYSAFLAALRADPTLSWARVYLEQARDQRLGISGKEPEKEPPPKVTKPKAPPRATPLRGKTPDDAPDDELPDTRPDEKPVDPEGGPPGDPTMPEDLPEGGGE